MQYLIFIETSDIGVKHSANAAKILGYKPVFICKRGAYQADTLLQLNQQKTIECDTTSIEAIKDCINSNFKIDEIAGITTLADSSLETACRLAIELGVKGSDKSILNLKSKIYVSNIVPEYSPEHLVLDNKNLPIEKIKSFTSKHKNVIVKPDKLTAGVGVKHLKSFELDTLIAHIENTVVPEHLEDRWILQETIEGDLFSIEGFVKEGVCTIIGVCNRYKIGLTESYFEFPVDESLSENNRKWINSAIPTLLRKGDFVSGNFHIEIIIGEYKNAIIDANIGRLGGGPLGELIPIALSISTEEFYAHVISRALNLPYTIDIPSINSVQEPAVGLAYGSQNNEYIEDIFIPKNLKCKHTLLLAPKRVIPPMGVDNWSWIGVLSGKKKDVLKEVEDIKLLINNMQVSVVF